MALHNPTRLDVSGFARSGGLLQGTLPLATLARLAESAVSPADTEAEGTCAWQAEGLLKQPPGGAPEVRLRLQARATVWLACQRCLQPAEHALQVDRTLRFVATEEEAERLDEASEDEDVLALDHALDLLALVEDELILALPIVPRHERCPQPLPYKAETEAVADAITSATQPNPFAVLAKLKKTPGDSP